MLCSAIDEMDEKSSLRNLVFRIRTAEDGVVKLECVIETMNDEVGNGYKLTGEGDYRIRFR